MKTCTKCHMAKSEADYFVKDKRTSKLHTQCKACYKEHRKTYYATHYEKYGELYRKRAKLQREKLRSIYRSGMLHYLSDKACVVCKESDVRVLEFDHIDQAQKSFTISQAVRLGYSWSETLEEMKKCRVLCANCHKKHTATQGGWYKA